MSENAEGFGNVQGPQLHHNTPRAYKAPKQSPSVCRYPQSPDDVSTLWYWCKTELKADGAACLGLRVQVGASQGQNMFKQSPNGQGLRRIFPPFLWMNLRSCGGDDCICAQWDFDRVCCTGCMMLEERFSLGLEQGCQCYPVSTQCCLWGKRVMNEPEGQNALLNSRVGMQIVSARYIRCSLSWYIKSTTVSSIFKLNLYSSYIQTCSGKPNGPVKIRCGLTSFSCFLINVLLVSVFERSATDQPGQNSRVCFLLSRGK